MLLWNAWCRENNNEVSTYPRIPRNETCFRVLTLVFSSLIIDHLLDYSHQRQAVGIACFYCNYLDQSTQTLENILGSLLRQFLITCANSSVYDSWTNTLESIQKGGKRVVVADILNLMRLVLDSLLLAFL